MSISRQRNQPGPAESACYASDAASQLDTGCKILPFRQRHLRESSGPGELVHGYMVAEPDGEESLEARRSFLAVCVPEYSETVSCHNPFLAGRWLKRVLILSTFTAWTAAAIAVAIALD